MQYSNCRICLDIQASGSGVVLSAKRGDTGRKLFVTLTDGGTPYTLSEDCYAVFTARKPDGHLVFNECTVEDNTVVYTVREQVLAAAGAENCEIRLYGAEGMLLTSACFTLLVDGTVYTEGDEIESSDDFSALTALITQNQTLRDELLKLKEELENGGSSGGGTGGGADGVTFIPSVSEAGDLSWTNNAGLENPETVNIKGPQGLAGKDGYTPVKGTDYFTEGDQQQLVEDVLEQVPEHTETVRLVAEALPKVSAVNFANFEQGSFSETVDGSVVTHAVSFDSEGRPAAIDDIVITWEA